MKENSLFNDILLTIVYADKTTKLVVFFWVLFFILFMRLFYLQIVMYDDYKYLLYSQHYSQSFLKPKRWDIYLEDKNGSSISMTQNINMYELYVDPFIIYNKEKTVKILTPILYDHFCTRNLLEKPEPKVCIKNVESFIWKDIIEKKESEFYLSGDDEFLTWTSSKASLVEETIENIEFNTWMVTALIYDRLNFLLEKAYIKNAYIWFFHDEMLLERLKNTGIAWLSVSNWYVNVDLDKVKDISKTSQILSRFLITKDDIFTEAYLSKLLKTRPKRYVKLADFVDPVWIKSLKEEKKKYKDEKQNRVPLLHWVWFKKLPFRYYPYWSFLSSVIGYVDNNQWKWWVEEYYDSELRWKEWKIVWMNTPWIWQIVSNMFEIQQPANGASVYLTIDPTLQKKVEQIVQYYFVDLVADNISVVIIDPYNGDIKSMISYPNFDINQWKDVYNIQSLTKEYSYLVDDETFLWVPVLVKVWNILRVATVEERKDRNLKKYMFKNKYWPQVAINEVISLPYEPWSIFKILTLAIWIDTDTIDLYDYYQDNGKVKIWPYSISNIAKQCTWYHTFLHAIERSCNVWMVRIVQKLKRQIFYNYLENMWFGKLTWIQLKWEKRWAISALQKFSYARFFNNSFWQWLLVTPLQIALAYSATINGGYLLKPSIVKRIEYENKTIDNTKYIVDKVFSSKLADSIKHSLYTTIYEWDLINLAVTWFTLGWKTWTSQIAYLWKYQQWKWWTIWSFAWIVTKENLKYVVVVKVTRPRKCQWWICSAWEIYKDIAKFIIWYEKILK